MFIFLASLANPLPLTAVTLVCHPYNFAPHGIRGIICDEFHDLSALQLEVTSQPESLVRPFDNETGEHFLATVVDNKVGMTINLVVVGPSGRFEFGGRRKRDASPEFRFSAYDSSRSPSCLLDTTHQDDRPQVSRWELRHDNSDTSRHRRKVLALPRRAGRDKQRR